MEYRNIKDIAKDIEEVNVILFNMKKRLINNPNNVCLLQEDAIKIWPDGSILTYDEFIVKYPEKVKLAEEALGIWIIRYVP